MILGKKAPDFTAAAVLGDNSILSDFNLYKNIGEKGALIFFYPRDFAFVCPTELIALNKRYEEFKSRGIEVIAVSGDNELSHLAWKNTPINKGGVGQLVYPMVADLTRSIARSFDVLYKDAIPLRAAFLLDENAIVKHLVVNDIALGRNIDELIRMVDAMLFVKEHGELCPAGWVRGDSTMKADTKSVLEYLSKNEDKL